MGLKERVEVSSPGKLMLFGEHAVVYDQPCIVTAVNQRLMVTVEAREDGKLVVNAPDVGLEGYTRNLADMGKKEKVPKAVKFVETAVSNYIEAYPGVKGVNISTRSQFSSKFGFGSSSAVTVGVVKGMAEVFGKNISDRELFDLSYKTVLNVQGVGSGFDLAAAIWGGTVYFVTGGKEISPMDIGELPLVVGYTGIKADTSTFVRQVAELREEYTDMVDSIFNLISDVVEEGKVVLEQGSQRKIGELMDINQGLLNSLGVSTPEIENLVFAVRQSGAHGAKLSGAGGGDCMIAYTPAFARRKVEEAIKYAGGVVIDVKTGAEGVRVEP